MMKKIVILALMALLFTPQLIKSQDYNTAIGFKFGSTNGISFKQFLGGSDALEIVVGSKYRGVHALVLYEIHAPAFAVDGLYWYYGGGGHVGFWDGKYYGPFDEDNRSFVGIGADGVLGIEYQIREIPITVSLDLVPSFNIIGYTGFWMDGGLGLRYAF